MENLKIRVNSADESKEAQELFFKLGGSWAGYKEIQTLSNIAHLYLENDCIRFGGDAEYFEKYTGLKEVTMPELRAMVNQDQDEPFLTPETTLNDQYAEIEEVRQAAKDNVNHPSHYTQGKVECIDALESATIGKSGIEAVCVANVIKYLWRYEDKGGLESILKAKWYLDKLIECKK